MQGAYPFYYSYLSCGHMQSYPLRNKKDIFSLTECYYCEDGKKVHDIAVLSECIDNFEIIEIKKLVGNKLQ